MLRRLYVELLNGLLRKSFPLWQALGLHVTPNHFYQPVPDTRRLPDALWAPRLEIEGVDLRVDEQLALLSTFESRYRDEYDAFPRRPRPGAPVYYMENLLFSAVDAQVLYCMVRYFKPRRIVEVGAGLSTLVFSGAIERNRAECPERACDFATIDPYPPAYLAAGAPALGRTIAARVQDLPLGLFASLGSGDILFVDSSHVLAVGSDVQHLLLRVLPRLAPGVVVHFHDVFLPAEYPREWVVERRRFWNEQHALHAFLAFNRAYEVLWAGHFLHLTEPDALARAFGGYRTAGLVRGRRSLPGSFWIRRAGSG